VHPRGLTSQARSDWAALGRAEGPVATFDPAAAAALPAAVRRWLGHAIAPGTPLRTSVELEMHGEIRLGAWRPFTAVQRLSEQRGFVWAATARVLGLPVVGFDRFTRGSGQMRWRLANAVPVMRGDGEDVTRSAAGRHAGELLLALPAAALAPGVTWTAMDDDRATARVHDHDVTLSVAPDGALTALHMTRWGNPGKAAFGPQPFGATMEGEVSAGGFTIPQRIAAGWLPGGEFIRYVIERAAYL
jgi:hypothetical protein